MQCDLKKEMNQFSVCWKQTIDTPLVWGSRAEEVSVSSWADCPPLCWIPLSQKQVDTKHLP